MIRNIRDAEWRENVHYALKNTLTFIGVVGAHLSLFASFRYLKPESPRCQKWTVLRLIRLLLITKR